MPPAGSVQNSSRFGRLVLAVAVHRSRVIPVFYADRLQAGKFLSCSVLCFMTVSSWEELPYVLAILCIAVCGGHLWAVIGLPQCTGPNTAVY